MKLPILVAFAVLVAMPAPARPCGNPITIAGDAAVKRVREAEKLLEREKYKEAAKKVNPFEYEFTDDALQRRATLVFAVARVRLGEASYVRDDLQALYAQDPDNPVIQARYAEAIWRFAEDDAQRKEAGTLIEDLVARDLVPDAHGWITAASVRAKAGDEAGRDDALAKCRAIAKKKSICRVR
jgi:predicted Zn-dependent protease